MAEKIPAFEVLLDSVRSCNICENLPLGPNPILQLDPAASILIVGQAPGRITHHKGIPFDDPSGNRLRSWLGVEREGFYDPKKFAILPMGFCFPGTGSGGDLPPRPECAEKWRDLLLERLGNVELTLVIGKYAMDWHLGDRQGRNLTDTVLQWEKFWPEVLPMPHPSPRNMRWMSKNEWFSTDVIPALQAKVSELLD